METQPIVFPVDFSHTGDAALEMASSIARDRGVKLLIVHVEEPLASYGGGEMYYGLPEPSIDDIKKMLHDVVPTDSNVSVEHHLLTGEPAHSIVGFADSKNAGMIVMGTHGRGGISRLLMGSVAEYVVRRAACPVLTCKQPADAASSPPS